MNNLIHNFILYVLILSVTATFGSSAAAQTIDDETVPVNVSKLTAINLDSGARRIKDKSLPTEIKDTFAKLIAAGGSRIRQGDSEVIVWGGNYTKSKGSQMIKSLEAALKSAGWEYEIGAKENDFILFSLFRAEPQRRALVGFFVPSDEAFVFALAEMVRADALENQNDAEESPEISSDETKPESSSLGKSIVSNKDLIGKWWRGEGSGSIDYTGKTQYKSGRDYTFEFFPDGTVKYSYSLDVLSIVQCRTKEDSNASGTVKVSGDTMIINLGATNSVGSSTCEKKNNFKRTLPPSSVTKKFVIKRMNSITRPDNPLLLCFDGQSDDQCFIKNGR